MKFREPDPPGRQSVAAVLRVEGSPTATWQVRAADGTRSNRIERFSGADAMFRSLRYAHEEYSRVRWLMN